MIINKYEHENQFARKILPFGFFIYILTFMINGLIPQLQMYFLDGNIFLSLSPLKVFVLAFLLLIIILNLRKKLYPPPYLMIPWFIFTIYISIEISLLFGYGKIGIVDLSKSVSDLYFFIFILPLMFFLQNSLSEKYAINTLIVLFLPLATLGITQHFTSDPILPLASIDESFRVFSTDFHGDVRAFSLFDSGYMFGHFIAISGALVILMPMHPLKKAVLLSVVIISGYCTLTRNTYLEILTVIFSALVLKILLSKRPTIPYFLSLFYGFVGYIIMNYADKFSGSLGNNITAINTHVMRLESWDFIKALWLNSGITTALFGTGLTQGYGFKWVDNMYLAIGAQFGIIGLIVTGALIIAMAIYVFSEARRKQTPLSIAIAAFWTSFPIVSYFNISIHPYILLFIILIMLKDPITTQDKQEKTRQYSE